VHTLKEEAVLVDQYAEKGYHPGELTTFLNQSDLAIRESAISVLKDYATLVGDLALGKRAQDLGTKTKALSQGITAAKAPTATASKSKGATLTPQQLNYVFSGLDMAIKPLIEHKVKKNLPASLAKADPYVSELCTLLSKDIDDLRSQEKSDYQVLQMEQSRFIRKDGLDTVERRDEIMKLLKIEQEAAKADADLVKAQKAVEQVAAAHHRLVEGEKK
jgi:hypothetical protein